MNTRQLKTLIKQELRRGMRSQYVIFSFVIFPLFMWGIQGGVQSVANSSLDTEGETVYLVNMDKGQLSLNLGDLIVDQMEDAVLDESSSVFNAQLNTSISGYTEAELRELVKQGISPMVIIPTNFTAVHQAFDIATNPDLPEVIVSSLPNDQFLVLSVQSELNRILVQPPFTQVTIEKAAVITQERVTFEGEENAGDPLSGIGFIAFLTIILAVTAPSAFVSSSFAGEREKRTLEALLALPMGRMSIMGGKLIAGLIMSGVFAVMNVVGIFMFNLIVGEEGALDVSAGQLAAISFVLLLTSFVALGFGVAIASFAKDQRTASTMYQMIMLIPAMLIGFTALFNGVPETLDLLYLVPWTHSVAVLMKGLFPQTFANSTLFGSIAMDLVFHLAYLMFFVLIFLFIGSRLFEREKILS
ncbi:MAG: ABC transporter permease [Candidatus Kariarchaeaceae archaeon]|jgi:ABC-type Na+ efflux pump permease subunit